MSLQHIPIKNSIELSQRMLWQINPIPLAQYQERIHCDSIKTESTFALKVNATHNQIIDPINDWFLVVQPQAPVAHCDYVVVWLHDKQLAHQNFLFLFLSTADDGSICVRRIDQDNDIFLIPPEDIAAMHRFQFVYRSKQDSALDVEAVDAYCLHCLAHEIAHRPAAFYQAIECCRHAQSLRAAIYAMPVSFSVTATDVSIDARLFQFFVQEWLTDKTLLMRLLSACCTLDDFRYALMNPMAVTSSVLNKLQNEK